MWYGREAVAAVGIGRLNWLFTLVGMLTVGEGVGLKVGVVLVSGVGGTPVGIGCVPFCNILRPY